jgi:transcriptional regulator with XRE-family HTH domain
VRNVVKTVGATIRATREAQKLSREILAERAGLHPNYIGAVERGEMNPGIENIERVARALKTPVYKLFLRVGEKPDPSADELLATIESADEKTRHLMLALVRAIQDWRKDHVQR